MPFSMEQLQERIAAWTAPVSADAPGGTSAKSEPAYDLVTSEVSKLESPTGGAVDWKAVAQEGGGLLENKSKDLLIASYFSYGLFETQGLSGLVNGVGVLQALIENYWDTCFPEAKRIRGRANAIAWFVDKCATALSQTEVTASDRAEVEALSTVASALATSVRAKFENHAPALTPLLESVQRLSLNLPEEKPAEPPPAPAPAPAPAAPAAQAPAAPATPPPRPAAPTSMPALDAVPGPGDLSTPEAALQHLAKLGGVVASTARAIRQMNPGDATAYRAVREGLWLHLVHPPPGGPDGKTSVPAPAAALRDRLEKLAANAKWPELLDEAESGLSQYRFWLDLHRYSAQALAALGHSAARDAVVKTLAGFLGRMPSLAGLSFNDASPFADDETRSWIDSEVHVGSAPSVGASASAAASGPEDSAVVEAEKLAKSGKPNEAMALLEGAVATAKSGRDRFRARLALARMCAGSGQAALGRPLFQKLDAESLERGLDVWEPGLSAQVLEGLITSIRKAAKKNEALAQELESLHVRLFFIDPSAAMRLGS